MRLGKVRLNPHLTWRVARIHRCRKEVSHLLQLQRKVPGRDEKTKVLSLQKTESVGAGRCVKWWDHVEGWRMQREKDEDLGNSILDPSGRRESWG